jgi:hypothetical protein
MKKLLFLLSSLALTTLVSGQTDTIYNTHALEKIPYYEQLYRFRVWRDVDFKEKQNAVFVSPYSNIATFILDNLKSGNLKAYAPDDFTFAKEVPAATVIAKGEKATFKEFSALSDYGAGDEVTYGEKTYKASRNMTAVRQPTDQAYWRQDRSVRKLPPGLPAFDQAKSYATSEAVAFNGAKYIATDDMNGVALPTDKSFWDETGAVQEFLTFQDISVIQVVEDVIFDKRRSRLYYDIQGFIILDPTTGNPNALVSYKEFSNLVEKFSHDREIRVRNTVKWKNRYNPSQDMNFVDAFKLRLFHGVINKVENPDDESIFDIIVTKNGRTYGESVFARWEEEMKMMEKEHNLWEY